MKNFTKINDNLRRSKKIIAADKIMIGYIIGWQESGKTLTATNKYIAEELGLTIGGIRSLIKRCNKNYYFFNTTQNHISTTNGNYSSNHELTVDVDKLEIFLTNVQEVITKEVDVVIPEVKEDILEDVIVTTKEIAYKDIIEETGMLPLKESDVIIEDIIIENKVSLEELYRVNIITIDEVDIIYKEFGTYSTTNEDLRNYIIKSNTNIKYNDYNGLSKDTLNKLNSFINKEVLV